MAGANDAAQAAGTSGRDKWIWLAGCPVAGADILSADRNAESGRTRRYRVYSLDPASIMESAVSLRRGSETWRVRHEMSKN